MTLTPLASGHLSLDLDDAEESVWVALRLHVRVLYDFEEVGSTLQKDNIVLQTGYDSWSGYYLMAQCADGDAFLQKLAQALQETDDPVF